MNLLKIVLDLRGVVWYYGTMTQLPEWELAAMGRGRRTTPLIMPLIQGLSDGRTMRPQAEQAMPTVFVDEIAGGSIEPMPVKVAPIVDKPEYVITAPVKRVSKHEERLRATTAYASSLNKAIALVQGKPEPKVPKPAHNQIHTESGLVITVKVRRPNTIKRRF